ncbi:isochorismatase family protein [Nocardia macrotermitis]|nr:isochorismatase family protein [Nocardia macrotermitis]
MASEVQLLFADLQESIVPLGRTRSESGVRAAARVLAQVADLLELPATVSIAPRPEGPDPIVELSGLRPVGGVQVRTGAGCLDHVGTRDALLSTGRPTVLICGVLTELVVQLTALDLIEAGMRVYVALDACAGLSDSTELAALRRIESAGGYVGCVPNLAADMVRDFTTPTGARVIGALHGLFSAA